MTNIYITIFILLYSGMAGAQSLMNIHLANQTTQQLELTNIDSITYSIDGLGNSPIVSTISGEFLNLFTHTSGGHVVYEGSSPVTSRGICWNNSPNPGVQDNVISGQDEEKFVCLMNSLIPAETYFVRAFAINATDTAYGSEFSFEVTSLQPCAGAETVTDASGNIYPTVQIGGQCWMAGNLRTTTYANGDPLLVPSSSEWNNGGISEGAWTWYEDDSSYEIPNGKLYNSYAVADERNVCPANWHAATVDEWLSLMQQIDFTAIINTPVSEIYASSEIASDYLLNSDYTSFNLWFSGIKFCPGIGFGCLNIGLEESSRFLSGNEPFWIDFQSNPDNLMIISDVANDSFPVFPNSIYAVSVRCVKDE